MGIKCPKCNTDNPDTQSFCGDCGTQLGTPKDSPVHTKTLETPFPQFKPGTSLANRYEIINELGKGGMGEVYLAEDTSLKRRVAIKVLPQPFALDKERLARFEREARLLASLNHPNIATIHGLEKSNGQQFLVMELIEGETLRERISKGSIPVEEALEICRQLAEGLESAHEKGIIHRDLKPSNIKFTPEGKVKILDFGIAKAFHELPYDTDSEKGPPIVDEMTRPGMVLGTAAYMSPEQAKGKAVDKRTDIWAFGCILFECLTGKRAFKGETSNETFASILKGEPEWGTLSAAVPAGIHTLVRRCLRKNKNRRQHDISDARIEIEDSLISPQGIDQIETSIAGKLGWRHVIPMILGAVLVTALIMSLVKSNRKSPEEGPVVRSEIGVEPAKRLGASDAPEQRAGNWRPSRTSIALSPDGSLIVFEGVDENGSQLYKRTLGKGISEPIADTEGGQDPFFSPDGSQIGFYANRKLMKIRTNGGMATPICDTGRPFGASWGPDDMIVYSNSSKLKVIDASGGNPEILTERDRENGEVAHISPHVLPGGKAVLFSIQTSANPWYDPKVAVLSLKTKNWKTLIDEGADARYSPTGHIVFARQGTLWAVPFSLNRLELTGEAKKVISDVMQAVNANNTELRTFAAQFSFSKTGILAYVPGGIYPIFDSCIVIVNKDGIMNPLIKAAGSSFFPRMSPDQKKIVYRTYGENREIWTFDIEAEFSQPLVRARYNESLARPIWTPDGMKVTYQHTDAERSAIYWTNADGTGEPELLIENGAPNSWSPDGKRLAFVRFEVGSGSDIWILSRENKKAKPFLKSQSFEEFPEFSPDGKFLAYSSNKTGRMEIYVTPFIGAPIEIPVSNEGGLIPVWSPDMKQLYYIEIWQTPRVKMMVADINTTPSFKVIDRRVLFDYWGLVSLGDPVRAFDIHPDGQGFIFRALFYGGKAINFSDIPQDLLDGLASQNKISLAWFRRWLKEDKDQILSPELKRMLQGQTVTRINIVQNWFEELKRLVPPCK